MNFKVGSNKIHEAKLARYYRTARTAHLERLKLFVPGTLYYKNTMYDFDLSLLPPGTRAEHASFMQILKLVWNRKVATLEVVEPYAPSALPQTVVLTTVWRASRILHRRPVTLTAYAIENADLPAKYSQRYRLPRWLVKLAFRQAVSYGYFAFSRIVFGTEDAMQNYRKLIGKRFDSSDSPDKTMIPGLPAPRASQNRVQSDIPLLIFLGAFDERKGIRQLLAAWPHVIKAMPEARLLVMGKGPLESEVKETGARLDNVHVVLDPSRDFIWSSLESATALCLISQPATGWKEQIGLPIVEALSVGLEIIASDESGIANWLKENGHCIVPWDISAEELSVHIVRTLRSPRSLQSVLSSLPAVDGRITADRWLHEPQQP